MTKLNLKVAFKTKKLIKLSNSFNLNFNMVLKIQKVLGHSLPNPKSYCVLNYNGTVIFGRNKHKVSALQLKQLSGKMQPHWHWKQHTHHIQHLRIDVLPLQLPKAVDHASPKACQILSSHLCKNIDNLLRR